jgi:hypothetical protein
VVIPVSFQPSSCASLLAVTEKYLRLYNFTELLPVQVYWMQGVMELLQEGAGLFIYFLIGFLADIF